MGEPQLLLVSDTCGALWPVDRLASGGVCSQISPWLFPGSLWGLSHPWPFSREVPCSRTCLSSSVRSCNSSSPHRLFSRLCLVDREPEIDLRHKKDDQGNKTKGCSVSAAAGVAYRQTRVYFIRWVSEPTCWVPSSSFPDIRRLERYLIK